ncbi:MAG: Uma2 family endonuclease [Chloroflexaceae bacterium]
MTVAVAPEQHAAVETKLTVADLAQIADPEQLYDLVNGELLAMPRPKYRHGCGAVRLSTLIGNYADTHNLGDVVTETGFILACNPDVVRGPDLAFIAAARVPEESEWDNYFAGAPDLAVEIVSPSDNALDLRTKIGQYLAAGMHLIWVVYPTLKLIDIYRADKTATVLHAADTLDGETLLPGLHIPVAAIFA